MPNLGIWDQNLKVSKKFKIFAFLKSWVVSGRFAFWGVVFVRFGLFRLVSGRFGLFQVLASTYLTSFDISATCEPRVVLVFKSSCFNSDFVSLFSTASVWVPLILISMFQYQINKMLLLTRQHDCKT